METHWKFRGAVTAAGIMLLLSGCAGQSAERGPALSGEEIRSLLEGNTLVGAYGVSPFTFYFEPGGAVRGIMRNRGPGNDSGTWEIQDDLYCNRWTEIFDGDRRCYRVYPSGDQFFFDNADAFRTFGFSGRVKPGRPEGQW